MKASGITYKVVASMALGLVLLGCEKSVKLESDTEKASYAVGQKIGENMKTQGVTIDTKAVAAGIEDMLQGKPARLKPEEMQAALMKLQETAMKKMQEEDAKSKQAGAEYLEKNKKKDGVKTTESGLQYEVVKEGNGPKPKAEDVVSVHYVGTLTNGEKFDSSIDRGEPAEFPVGGVIPGWTEALKMMPVGSKWKLAIPSELAYGPMPRPGIPANSVLLFEVELLGINKKKN